MPSQERRTHPRRTIEGVHVHNGVISGDLLNFSARGLAVETSSGLRVGARYTFRLGRAWMSFRVTGIVRWSRLRGTRRGPDGEVAPIFVAGIAIDAGERTEDSPKSSASCLEPTDSMDRW
jgi:hypothetical protein